MSVLLVVLVALAAVLIFVLSRKPATCEKFVMQAPIQDAGLPKRGYDMAIVSTYCECAKRCADDDTCAAFSYAESAEDGLNVCELASRASSDGSRQQQGSLLTYVSDRCDVPDVA
jgi:hypothetical protein